MLLYLVTKNHSGWPPLKDWDIQINYGIKTGYNEAFIITTEKRDALTFNYADEDERKRTGGLI